MDVFCATHGLPTVWAMVYRGCPAGTHRCALRCPGRMASGPKRQLIRACSCACASCCLSHALVWLTEIGTESCHPTDDAVHARVTSMTCPAYAFLSCIRGSVFCAAHVSHLHVLMRLIARVSSWRCFPRTVSFHLLNTGMAVLPSFANTTFFVPSVALHVFNKVMASCAQCLLLAELQSVSRPGHFCLLGLLEGRTVTVAVFSARDVQTS